MSIEGIDQAGRTPAGCNVGPLSRALGVRSGTLHPSGVRLAQLALAINIAHLRCACAPLRGAMLRGAATTM